ncbi:MAG: hypothetical protein ABGW90_05555, partial [Martelella sp.]
MLNGTHSSLAYLGYLGGHQTIAETVGDPVFSAFVRKLWRNEIIPALTPPPGEDLAAYADALHDRYANPAIRHRTWQIAMDGSQKLPQRILGTIAEGRAAGRAVSVGLVGNAAEIYPEIARRGITPDIVTDQTSAHDLVYGYIPEGYDIERVRRLRLQNPGELIEVGRASIARHVSAMLDFQQSGAEVFDNGNLIRTQAQTGGVENAFDIPVFTEAYLRPLFCRAIGPFRWMALSGEASDIGKIDDLVLEMFPDNKIVTNWIRLARDNVPFEGLPARIAWLGHGERSALARGPVKNSYIVLSGDHPLTQGYEGAGRIIGGTMLAEVETVAGTETPFLSIPDFPDLPMEEVYPREEPRGAAVVTRETTAGGRTVYIPWNIGSIFWEVLTADHQRLIENAVRWAMGGTPRVSVSGHSVLDIAVRESGDTLAVLLFNLTNPMMFKGPTRSIYPVGPHTVSIAIPKGRSVRDAQLLIAGKTAEYRATGDTVEVVVPGIDLLETVEVRWS